MVTAITRVAGETLFAASTRGAHHRRAALGVDIQDGHAKRGSGAAGARHGVGNVVKFEVQENRQPHIDKGPHPARAMGAEEFQPQLQPADMGPHPFGQLAGIVGIGCV